MAMFVGGHNCDLIGNLQALKYGNGVTNLCQYDAMNRLTNQVWKSGSPALGSFAYTLGPTGNRTALTETVNGTSRSYAWSYDYLYRLTGENLGSLGAVNYKYDSVGNRTNRTSTISQLSNTNSSYNANDWLTSDNYDDNGNTIASSANAYEYDVMNRLTNVNSGAILIGYDGNGNRVKKTVGGTTTYYLVDDVNPSGYAQVLEEYRGSTLTNVYNYALDLISQRVPGTSTNYFIYDGRGSTRILTDNGGSTVNAFAYDAYGTLIVSNSTPQTLYLYCGQQFDIDLGLYYNRARYLNIGTGRFWTMDSYEGNNEDPVSLHKYLYANVNPVNINDPSGHDGELASLNFSMTFMAGFVAFSGATLLAAEHQAIGTLATAALNEASIAGASLAATAESVLSVYRTSVRDLIKQAEDSLKQTGRALKKVKVIPIPRSIIPDVAANITAAEAIGKPMVLERVDAARAVINRAAATAGVPPAGPGMSLDEYPFASSRQGGIGARVVPVPAIQNSIQGGIIGGCYKIEKINVGTPYIVIVTP